MQKNYDEINNSLLIGPWLLVITCNQFYVSMEIVILIHEVILRLLHFKNIAGRLPENSRNWFVDRQ